MSLPTGRKDQCPAAEAAEACVQILVKNISRVGELTSRLAQVSRGCDPPPTPWPTFQDIIEKVDRYSTTLRIVDVTELVLDDDMPSKCSQILRHNYSKIPFALITSKHRGDTNVILAIYALPDSTFLTLSVSSDETEVKLVREFVSLWPLMNNFSDNEEGSIKQTVTIFIVQTTPSAKAIRLPHLNFTKLLFQEEPKAQRELSMVEDRLVKKPSLPPTVLDVNSSKILLQTESRTTREQTTIEDNLERKNPLQRPKTSLPQSFKQKKVTSSSPGSTFYCDMCNVAKGLSELSFSDYDCRQHLVCQLCVCKAAKKTKQFDCPKCAALNRRNREENLFQCEKCGRLKQYETAFWPYCCHVLCRDCAKAAILERRTMNCPLYPACSNVLSPYEVTQTIAPIDIEEVIDFDKLIEAPPIFICPLCLEKCSREDVFIVSPVCKHETCRNCAKEYFWRSVVKGDGQLKCYASTGCEAEISPDDIELCGLTLEQLQRLRKVLFKRGIRGSNFIHCPKPNCKGVLEDHANSTKHFICPIAGCGYEMCTRCKQNWHQSRTCRQNAMLLRENGIDDETRRMWAQLKRDGKYQDCRQCGIPIEKTEGCNHMQCPVCDSHFCYLCGHQFPSKKWENHRNCRIFDAVELESPSA